MGEFRENCKRIRAALPADLRGTTKIVQDHRGLEVRSLDGRTLYGSTTAARGHRLAARAKVLLAQMR